MDKMIVRVGDIMEPLHERWEKQVGTKRFVVESIEECKYAAVNSTDPVCMRCPGKINGRCFGVQDKYIIKLLTKEWDEEGNV